MNSNKERTWEGLEEEIMRICDEIDNDPKTREDAKECQRTYGTLTKDDLQKVVTI